MSENKNQQLTVATINPDGSAPTNRISNAQGLWSSFQECIQLAQRMDIRFASINGCADGLPPVDPSVLEAQGLQDAPNFNTKQMTAKLNTYVSTWTDHNTSGDTWYDVQCKPEHAKNAVEWSNWNKDLTQFFNDGIKEWDATGTQNASQFIFESMTRDQQMARFGIGVAYFRDPIDWRWECIPTRNVYVPEGTKLTLENAEAVFVVRRMTVTQLYNLVKNQPDGGPWDKTEVYRAIYNRTEVQGAGITNQSQTFADWERRVRNNDTWMATNFLPIYVVDCYIQEFTTYREKAGISHYVIVRDGNNEGYLYEKNREYETYQDILVAFADNSGPEGDWHGVKGFGDLIYDGCHFNNCMFNQLAFGSIMTTMPMFQAAGEADRQKLNQVVFSRLGILFPDLQISQFKLDIDLTGGLGILTESNRILDSNTRIFPQNQTSRRGSSNPTATEVIAERQDQVQFQSGQLKLYRITGADRLGYVMYKRMSAKASDYPEAWPGGKAAKNFREKCEKAGIPPKCYTDIQYVRASRSGGTGNMAADAMKADQVMQIATPGAGQLAAKAEKVAALYGRERVTEFIQAAPPPVPESQWVQSNENPTIQDGKIIPAFPWDTPEIHLGEANLEGTGHLAVLMAAQQAATALSEDKELLKQNLEDAKMLNRVLEAGIAHLAMHGTMWAQTPSNEAMVKALAKFIRDLQTFHEAFGEDIAKTMHEGQQQQPQIDAESLATLQKAKTEAEATMIKTQAEVASKALLTESKIKNTAATTVSRNKIKEMDAVLAAQRKEAQANVDLGIKAEQALADQLIAASQAKAKTTAKRNEEVLKE